MSDKEAEERAPESVRSRLRREAGRVDAGCAISLFRDDGGTFVGTVTDISDTGLFVATDEPCSVGERLRVTFRLPGSSAVLEAVIEARSPRSGNPLDAESKGFGASFQKTDELTRAIIERFVRG